ncbi:prepilin-type N-terminal cleavage/methylation domain-containing protein [Vibrio maerlii]|uniref:prepilin-type N-terminal cleavage/methylation domain-containing protein n=1 Tax=Vibrio maerlii TaxID=2231648 RepID=UPI0019CFA351|nr:prepilin-type N-terminal cleavage/methylation domain-containing protein [Vibrio maerlii]
MTIRKHNGFTLVELVVVIVILGILSVFAAPRFINLSGEAGNESAAAVFADFGSAIDIFHAVCLARDGAGDTSFNANGIYTDNNGSCYPKPNFSRSKTGIHNVTACSHTINDLANTDLLGGLTYSARWSDGNEGGTNNSSGSLTSNFIQDALNNSYPVFIHQPMNAANMGVCHFYFIDGDLSNAPYFYLDSFLGLKASGRIDLTQPVDWDTERAKYM